MEMEERKTCLVLSGGGAKGVYHIGVWKALKELGITIHGIVGNSIGAIVAAFLVQGLDSDLEEIGSGIGLNFILNVPEELIEGGELAVDKIRSSAFGKFYRSVVEKKGLDTGPLRKLLEEYISEDEIRTKGMDFGIVGYNITDMKPEEVFLENMEEGTLIDYIMASSAFPGFRRPEIAGKKYIDGGVYDNIPFGMAKRRGYRDIIVVDISGVGVKRRPDIEGIRTTYIKNTIDMGGVLDFDRQFLDEYTRLGYLDTMRTFGRYRGHGYFILPDPDRENRFRDFLESGGADWLKDDGSTSAGDSPSSSLPAVLMDLFPKHSRYHREWLPVFLDCAADAVGVERIREWTYGELIDEIDQRAGELASRVGALSIAERRKIKSRVRAEIRDKKILKPPYYYSLLMERFLPKKLGRALSKLLDEFSPELPAARCVLKHSEDFRES